MMFVSGTKKQRIEAALRALEKPSTAFDVSLQTGLTTHQVASILRGMENIKVTPVDRNIGYRNLYVLKDSLKMFGFVTHTESPIAGCHNPVDANENMTKNRITACAYDCRYCWANDMINNGTPAMKAKYTGPYRVHPPAMKKKYKSGSTVFTQHMTDIGAPDIPRKVVEEALARTRSMPDVNWLFLTKADDFYLRFEELLPPKAILGFTIETNRSIPHATSRAPDTRRRLWAADKLKRVIAEKNRIPGYYWRLFICIEPVMDFDYLPFLHKIQDLKPWKVAIGYDNYYKKLVEPDIQAVRSFILALAHVGIPVHEKNLNRA